MAVSDLAPNLLFPQDTSRETSYEVSDISSGGLELVLSPFEHVLVIPKMLPSNDSSGLCFSKGS